jgi:Caspase domain
MTFAAGHALLIGVGQYQFESHLTVPTTAADARALDAVLRNPQYCGYPQDQARLLVDTAASRKGILTALDELAQRASEDATVTIFYSGHGIVDAHQTYYLTTTDTKLGGVPGNRTIVDNSAISQQELLEKLRALKAKRVLLLFNACHSGEVSPVLDVDGAPFTGQNPPSNTTAAALATGSGRVIITACREQQYAFIGDGEQTIFTQALLEGLRGEGVSSRGGYISAFDLYTYVYYAVGEAVQQLPEALRAKYGDTQEPELTVLKGVGPFAVALYRGATTLGEFRAPEGPPTDTAVREVSSAQSRALLGQVLASAPFAGATIHTEQSGGVNLGMGNTIGTMGDVVASDKVSGDKVTGDNITTGNITGSSGIAIGRGAQATVTRGLSGGEAAQLFQAIYAKIAASPEDDAIKEIVVDKVKAVETEVAKGEQANASKIESWLKVIAKMMPDILEVTANTLLSPISGVATVVKKVAEKAKAAAGRG